MHPEKTPTKKKYLPDWPVVVVSDDNVEGVGGGTDGCGSKCISSSCIALKGQKQNSKSQFDFVMVDSDDKTAILK